MEKIKENSYYQIAYDFKVFIRESLIYDYDMKLLKEFANYMDSIYYPNFKLYSKFLSIPYVNINKIILRDTFSIELYDKKIIDDAHLGSINLFIKNYYDNKKIHMADKVINGICLYDFIVASSSVIYDWNEENFLEFSNYMLNQFPNYPYKKICNMINKLDNSDRRHLTCVIDQKLCKFSDGSFNNYIIDRDRYEYIMRYEVGCIKSKKKIHQ